MEQQKILSKTENPDSLEIGSASKGGVIKIYGDFNKKDEFKQKIDKAIELRAYARLKNEYTQD